MTLIQILLIGIISLGVLQVLTATRHYRVFLLLVGAIAILLVITPDLATRIAKVLNVGRGADLIIYLSIALLGMLWVRLFLRGRAEQRQITMLTRWIAISQARIPSEVTSPNPIESHADKT